MERRLYPQPPPARAGIADAVGASLIWSKGRRLPLCSTTRFTANQELMQKAIRCARARLRR